MLVRMLDEWVPTWIHFRFILMKCLHQQHMGNQWITCILRLRLVIVDEQVCMQVSDINESFDAHAPTLSSTSSSGSSASASRADSLCAIPYPEEMMSAEVPQHCRTIQTSWAHFWPWLWDEELWLNLVRLVGSITVGTYYYRHDQYMTCANWLRKRIENKWWWVLRHRSWGQVYKKSCDIVTKRLQTSYIVYVSYQVT